MAKSAKAIAAYLSGEKQYQAHARAALPLLVRQALQRTTVFYSDLALELGMANERNLNYVLGYLGSGLESLSRDWKEKIPPIQCLVISKRDRMPGKGIGRFLTKKDDFRSMPRKEQRRLATIALEEVFGYPDWSSVLEVFGIAPFRGSYSSAVRKARTKIANSESRAAAFGGAGESSRHRKLKLFVAKNPNVIGLSASVGAGKTEVPLPSGDVLDVYFQHGSDGIAVEVKSSLSTEADIVRGIFQCVKYKAVLEAQQAACDLAQSARAILVLEAKLPANLLGLKNVLGVDVVDEIEPD
jgi:hypothetical protein